MMACCRSKTPGAKIAVVGPLAEQTEFLVGNYNGQPTHTVSILDGIRKEFANATVTYVQGTQFLGQAAAPVPASALSVDGKPGVKIDFAQFDIERHQPPRPRGLAWLAASTLFWTSRWRPFRLRPRACRGLSIQWTADLTAPETGDYNLGMLANGFFRMRLDGKSVTSSWGSDGKEAKVGHVHLEAGKPAKLEVDYAPDENGYDTSANNGPIAKLVWSKLDRKPQPEAIEAAKNADVVVAVVGITSELEGEEMPVRRARLQGRRPHQHRPAQAGRGSDRGPRRHRQAAGRGAGQRQRPGRQLGQGPRQRHPGSLVSGRRGRRGRGRNPLRHEQSRRTPARHLLQRVSISCRPSRITR